MKILAISGSSRNKHTNYMLHKVLERLGGKNETELVMLKDLHIQPCKNCKCCHKSFKCVTSDDMQNLYGKLAAADIVLLGSPTYFDNVSGIMKNFMDRCLPFYFSLELKDKLVGLLAVGGFSELIDYDEKGDCRWCREGDQCNDTVGKCLNSMEYFCEILGMKTIGKIASIHGTPEKKDDELEKMAERLLRI